MRTAIPALFVFTIVGGGPLSAADAEQKEQKTVEAPPVASFLYEGRLDAGEQALQATLEETPGDAQARFGLGVVQFLQAVEGLAQEQYRYGLMTHRTRQLPFMRFPLPKNPDPERISYEKARQMFETFLGRLQTAEATLAEVDTSAEVKLPLHFGRIRLDLNGDGEASEEETLWRVYARLNRRLDNRIGRGFRITFDGGDVHWLRGYCHLLSAFGEINLAYDWRELFERTGHLFYPRVKSPHDYLQNEPPEESRFAFRPIADLIAFIHLINFEVEQPQRMKAAHGHLRAMVEQSRQSWELILAETDDDHEWLPNPQQTGVLPVGVSGEMIAAWRQFLEEFDALLRGERLVPFWRGDGSRGVNLRRVFLEPRRFDLVMWVQGTGAAPYLETGELTDPRVWRRLRQVFRGNFVGFAIWFN